MSLQQLNLGILAHVDAGKTTLTERLLYEAGAIAAPGRVDAGTTQTDSLAIERRRGITIRSAVASFRIGDLHVNLVDTPGHPDFIAEVERVLGVLDGAILVVSAVEGVQPQTRILFRALERLGLPTLFFVNKIDRLGADGRRVLQEIAGRLTPAVAALAAPAAEGTPVAAVTALDESDPAVADALVEALADRDDGLLRAWVDGAVTSARLRAALAEQTARALVRPVLFGSAATGAGTAELLAAIRELLPPAGGDPVAPVSARVFKIERGDAGEKVAYARLFEGTIAVRDRVSVAAGDDDTVTALAVFNRGLAEPRPTAAAGEVAKLWGLRHVRVGDRIGAGGTAAPSPRFPPPTLEAVVEPQEPAEAARLREALLELTEQDPLIGVRQDEDGALAVALYGEVQKEVLEATLADDYGLAVRFCETATVHVERPARAGEALELLHAATNPYFATMGIRIEPAAADSGLDLRLAVEHGDVPLYLYKTAGAFAAHMREYVTSALAAGLHGWRVVDCVVTVTRLAYSIADGPPSRRGPTSTAADFRKLTPLVVRQALAAAGTVVCAPAVRGLLEVPGDSAGAVLAALARLGAPAPVLTPGPELVRIETTLTAAQAGQLERALAGLTAGEGTFESAFAGFRPVAGPPPVRRRRASAARTESAAAAGV